MPSPNVEAGHHLGGGVHDHHGRCLGLRRFRFVEKLEEIAFAADSGLQGAPGLWRRVVSAAGPVR